MSSTAYPPSVAYPLSVRGFLTPTVRVSSTRPSPSPGTTLYSGRPRSDPIPKPC
jgi:hypothetical protein